VVISFVHKICNPNALFLEVWIHCSSVFFSVHAFNTFQCIRTLSVASSGMGHWGTCPMEFANARKFCRPNARWLSFLDNFVTTNFGTRAPRARAPWSKIRATPVDTVNSRCSLFRILPNEVLMCVPHITNHRQLAVHVY